jgi:hypothetical protein
VQPRPRPSRWPSRADTATAGGPVRAGGAAARDQDRQPGVPSIPGPQDGADDRGDDPIISRWVLFSDGLISASCRRPGDLSQIRSLLRQPPSPAARAASGVQNPCPKSTSHNHRCRKVVRRSQHGASPRLRARLHTDKQPYPLGRCRTEPSSLTHSISVAITAYALPRPFQPLNAPAAAAMTGRGHP